MKLSLLLLTAFMLEAGANGIAQNVSFSGNNVPLENVLSDLERQTGYYFLYTKETLNKSQPVSISVKDMPLTDFLNKIFESQPLTYTIASKTITITPLASVKTPPDKETNLAVVPFAAISGIIVDAKGLPVAGATIAVKGSNKGTSAGNDGRFSLSRIPDNAVIEVSAVGFTALTLKIVNNSVVIVAPDGKIKEQLSNGSSENIIVRLSRSISPLDVTVIIAYGSTTRRLITGSVSTVTAEEIEKQPVMNLQQALQGRVPGLDITITNGNSAAPVKMEIRGRNSLNPNVLSEPLYVIDGVPYNVLNVNKYAALTSDNPPETSYGMSQAGFSNTNGQNILSFINPKDIESVDVLKDADATAIYGSRGSNGVILITTKKPKPGPTRFNLNIEQGIELIPKYLDFLSTKEYLEVRKEAFRNDGIIPTNDNAIDLTVWDQNRYTNWQKVLYGTGKRTAVSARVSGGLQQTAYSIAAGYRSSQPLMNNSGKNVATNLNMGIDHRSADQKFNLAVTTILTLTNYESFNIGGTIALPPNAPAMYDKNGDLNFEGWRSPTNSFNNFYPFSGLKTGNKSKTQNVSTSMNMGYQVVKGLNVSIQAGYTFDNNSNDRFQPKSSFDPAYPFSVATAFYGTTVNNLWSIEPQLTYKNYIGRGNLTLLAGGSLYTNTTKSTTLYGSGYPNDDLINSINNAMTQFALEGYAEYKYTAGFARLSYNWANKYIINLNARRDGSSRFGPGKQFGNFGSVGVAWIASDEKWLKKGLPSWISFIKFSGSYGSTGGDGSRDYQYLTRWSINAGDYGNKWGPYGGVQSILAQQPVNQKYQWESTTQIQTGVDLSFFKDKLNVTAAYYRKRSGNQLTNVPTPVYTGFGSVLANWGAFVQNAGFEFSAFGKIVNSKDFFIATRFNLSINRNKLLKYPDIDRSPYATRYQVGKSVNARYYLHYTGVDPVRGTPVFEDRNKDGVISAYTPFKPGDPDADRYVPIDLTPKYYGGFGIQIAYRQQFDVDMFFRFNNKKGTNPLTTLVPGSMNNIILPDEIKNNHWQKPGDIALYPRYTNINDGTILESDGAYTDASFIELNSISISYELPKKLISKAKMNACRLSVQARNLFYITSYKGPNPEAQGFKGISPISRLISSSLTFNF
jgi:TonB-linked SusC/RagA family outer membrane protein